MTFRHGRDTEVLLGGADISAYLNAAEFNVDVETAETTTFKRDWKTAIAGRAVAAYQIAGLFDPTFTDMTALVGDDPGAVLTVSPAGATTVGSVSRLVSVGETAYAESSPVGDVVAFNAAFMTDGTVGFGHMLKPLAAITADGNGTSYDGGAATTTGAIAHLHVTSVSAGDSVVVTIEDSANNSSWATIGTFASKAATGAERLVIAGTIRRYVRAVWNETNNGSPSITIAVALART